MEIERRDLTTQVSQQFNEEATPRFLVRGVDIDINHSEPSNPRNVATGCVTCVARQGYGMLYGTVLTHVCIYHITVTVIS